MTERDEEGLGVPLDGWTPPRAPEGVTITGQYTALEMLDPERHVAALHDHYAGHDDLWDYMSVGPFSSAALYREWVEEAVVDLNTVFYAIQDRKDDGFKGVASYLRIDPPMGSLEIGNICFSPSMKRSRVATEALYLMMAWAFDAGYRRVEWKCNALNLPSRRAAQRLGFSYEGVFRQMMIVKGRNRDTAWFAVTDQDWPSLRDAFSRWLDPLNFDGRGDQRIALSDLTRSVRVSEDPALRP
ncbi:MAG: GNAT family protein [Pseudomonadota bacterium]